MKKETGEISSAFQHTCGHRQLPVLVPDSVSLQGGGGEKQASGAVQDIICFSLFGSLSSNMKIIGIFIWGMLGLYILLALIIKRQFNKDVAIKGIACVFLWLSSYIIITPACWTGLWEFWYYLFSSASNFRWNDYILFMGHMYNKNSTGIPKIYLPTMISLTIPVGILLLAGIGSIIQITSLIRKVVSKPT